jgi:dTDP-4-amino-4,6-dideoxygalactose transaminase
MTFQALFEFESVLADFTGAPYAIATDCCTHAIELSLKYQEISQTHFACRTYISIPMTMKKLGIQYQFIDETWEGEYQFHTTNIWDSARRLERSMYRPGQIQCLSFGQSKPIPVGRLGAILTDNFALYKKISMWRSDGRDLNIKPWQDQNKFDVGYHYCPTLEVCTLATERLKTFAGAVTNHVYPDLRLLNFEN